MTLFALLAGLLLAVAAAFILVPLLRTGRQRGDLRTAAILAVLLIGAGAAVYWRLGNHQWPQAASARGVDIRAALLATERQPQDISAWLTLGQSYSQAEQYSLALRAYARANDLANGRSAAALAGMGEVLLLRPSQDNAGAASRAGALFEQVLQIDPRNAKGLFYGGALALRNGQLQQARDRFAAMLELQTPDNVRAALQKQIAALDAQLRPEPADPATALHITVNVKPELAARIDANTQLFVFVRAADAGAPLAVKRLPARFPVTVELSARDSMLAGRQITAGQRVQVVARLSGSGTPTAQSGDPYGELPMVAGQKSGGTILIDRLTP